MLMTKENRKAIYEYVLDKGVIVAKKDYTCKHPHVKEVPNLHVIKALQSMKSRGYVKEQFAWRHYYWYLTNEGIQYLRDYLHLPSQTIPETLRKPESAKRPGAGPYEISSRQEGRGFGDKPRGEGGFGGYRGDRGDRGERGERGDRPYRPAGEGGSRGFGRPSGGFNRGFGQAAPS